MTKKKLTAKPSKGKGFSDAEKSAMRERVREVQSGKEDLESALFEKIAEMRPSDRAIAERIHAIIKAEAPTLTSRLWYGMPAYALDGKTICFFQPAQKFKTRYATLGFNDPAHLDDGNVWPVAYALEKLTPADEKKIAAVLKKAIS